MGKDLKKVGIEMNISRVFMSNYIKEGWIGLWR
jgi:hypothetical protein